MTVILSVLVLKGIPVIKSVLLSLQRVVNFVENLIPVHSFMFVVAEQHMALTLNQINSCISEAIGLIYYR